MSPALRLLVYLNVSQKISSIGKIPHSTFYNDNKTIIHNHKKQSEFTPDVCQRCQRLAQFNVILILPIIQLILIQPYIFLYVATALTESFKLTAIVQGMLAFTSKSWFQK